MNDRASLKFPIGIKILLLIFFILIAALGTYFWIATHLILGDKKAAIFDYSQTQVTQLRQNVSSLLNGYDADLTQYFKSGVHKVVRSFVLAEVFNNPELLALFVTSQPQLLKAEIADTQNWHLPLLKRKDFQGQEESEELPPQPLEIDTLIQAFLAELEGDPESYEMFSGIKLVSLSPRVEQLVLGVAKYWRTAYGTLFGVIFFRGDEVLRSLTLQTNLKTSLVESDGRILIDRDLSLVFSRAQTDYQAQVEAMRDRRVDAQTLEVVNPKTREENLVSLVRLPGTSVYLSLETPLSLAYRPIRVLQMRSIYFVLAVLLASILMALFFSKTITGPIQALAEVAGKVKKGMYKVSLNLKSRDEIGELNQSFIEMTHELERRRIAIEHEIHNLKMIHESSREIALSRVTQELIPMVMQRLVDLISVDGILFVYRHSGGELLFDKVGDTPEDLAQQLERFPFEGDQTLVNFKEPDLIQKIPFLRSATAESLGRLGPAQDRIALLVAEGKCFGFVYVRKNTQEGGISVQDEYLLGAISTNVSITLRNIELVEETADKARLDNELKTAQLVQQTLLPQSVPAWDKVKLDGFYQPATECGGDWWGFFQLTDHLVVMIGDATGHGAGAALVTAAAKSAVSTISSYYEGKGSEFSTGKFMRMMNHALFETTRGQILMTFFCACIHLPTGKMSYTNAGHDFPWIYRSQKAGNEPPSKKFIDSLVMKGHHVGKQDNVDFEEQHTVLEKGDKLLMFTDGISELLNEQGEEYGSTRFLRSFVNNIHKPVAQIKEEIVQSAKTFAGKAAPADDLTMVLVEYTG
jgi:serine phosphatase RsbU (regulator of sigma subunit)/HAMP domain-containing protein